MSRFVTTIASLQRALSFPNSEPNAMAEFLKSFALLSVMDRLAMIEEVSANARAKAKFDKAGTATSAELSDPTTYQMQAVLAAFMIPPVILQKVANGTLLEAKDTARIKESITKASSRKQHKLVKTLHEVRDLFFEKTVGSWEGMQKQAARLTDTESLTSIIQLRMQERNPAKMVTMASGIYEQLAKIQQWGLRIVAAEETLAKAQEDAATKAKQTEAAERKKAAEGAKTAKGKKGETTTEQSPLPATERVIDTTSITIDPDTAAAALQGAALDTSTPAATDVAAPDAPPSPAPDIEATTAPAKGEIGTPAGQTEITSVATGDTATADPEGLTANQPVIASLNDRPENPALSPLVGKEDESSVIGLAVVNEDGPAAAHTTTPHPAASANYDQEPEVELSDEGLSTPQEAPVMEMPVAVDPVEEAQKNMDKLKAAYEARRSYIEAFANAAKAEGKSAAKQYGAGIKYIWEWSWMPPFVTRKVNSLHTWGLIAHKANALVGAIATAAAAAKKAEADKKAKEAKKAEAAKAKAKPTDQPANGAAAPAKPKGKTATKNTVNAKGKEAREKVASK